MVKAIVYTSNTGFTEKYAKMLAQEVGINVYNFKDAKIKLQKDDEIIYMGWIMASVIKNYSKAKQRYKIKMTCSIGMSLPNERQYKDIQEKNKINEKLFYLQGGYDKTKLKGIYKFMMGTLEKILKPKLEAKENKDETENEMLEMMVNGKKDCVSKENLENIITWLKENS